ncbi:hypothetical protein LEL_05170 [Akanthomyces lecanii RCEF 1005]|uniref:Uncharacterized protein n=1 Tax=Akanthomyces lecanii RCEF 1005 TaxID=1081108 RepID=A0A168HVX6_CORDF|nr:hypothetical protein LEL_05170 [Akanthomyces lecanii RCEF 1005]
MGWSTQHLPTWRRVCREQRGHDTAEATATANMSASPLQNENEQAGDTDPDDASTSFPRDANAPVHDAPVNRGTSPAQDTVPPASPSHRSGNRPLSANSEGYQPPERMSTEMTAWADKDAGGYWDQCDGANGTACSTRAGCCFSDHGGVCWSGRQGKFCSDRDGCCFSDRGGCCFSDNDGCCFSDDHGCCFSGTMTGRQRRLVPSTGTLNRAPFVQAQGFRRALRAHNLPCEFVAYPDQGHTPGPMSY